MNILFIFRLIALYYLQVTLTPAKNEVNYENLKVRLLISIIALSVITSVVFLIV